MPDQVEGVPTYSTYRGVAETTPYMLAPLDLAVEEGLTAGNARKSSFLQAGASSAHL